MCSVDDVAKASASDLRHAIAQSLSQIDIAQLGPAQQISWHERTADILWHANQNTLAALYYRLLSTNDAIPEPAARRIEIKAQAAETIHTFRKSCAFGSPIASMNLSPPPRKRFQMPPFCRIWLLSMP